MSDPHFSCPIRNRPKAFRPDPASLGVEPFLGLLEVGNGPAVECRPPRVRQPFAERARNRAPPVFPLPELGSGLFAQRCRRVGEAGVGLSQMVDELRVGQIVR